MLQLLKNDVLTSAAISQADVRQTELDFYTNIYWLFGGTATVMAGFVFGQLTNPVPFGTDYRLEFAYLVTTSLCLGLNLCVITWTVLCCMWGPGLALRGPDGMKSFHEAVTFLKDELQQLYNVFAVGVFCYFGSTCTIVWVYPSRTTVNIGCTAVLGCFMLVLIIVQFKLELRLGGSVISHDGADGRIRAFGGLEAVDDLDNFVSTYVTGARPAREPAPNANVEGFDG